DALRYIGQLGFFAVVAAFIGYFSSQPVYQQIPDGMAQIKLSFAHGAARKIDCRKLTSKEIAALPANERRPNTCTRERIPLHVQLILDGELLYDDQLEATGLSNDGPARTYQKLIVPAGPHTITARLRDSKRANGFDYEATHQVTLKAFQSLAVDFKADTGGFRFR
ncbi:MAG: hypothetical protein ACR2OM_12650, partial [Aestuariivirgaceae bacterium]